MILLVQCNNFILLLRTIKIILSYTKNFDLFCKNKVNKQNFEFLRLICEFYFKDNYVFHQLAFQQALELTKFAYFLILVLKKKLQN